MNNVKIKEIEIYHPSNMVDNEFYIEHFKQTKGEDLRHFLEDICGRNERYVARNTDENSLTMAVEATKKLLAKANMSVDELDMIIFSSQLPEYIAPANAIALHQAIGAGHHTGVFDINANCSGMTIGLEQASRYLAANPRMNKVLLVGSEALTLYADPSDTITYPNFGDCAVALILEKTEDENVGLIDSIYFTESVDVDKVTFPVNGLSKNLNSQSSLEYLKWIPFRGDVSIESATKIIKELVERNGLTTNKVDGYCLSQFSISNINLLSENLSVNNEKMIYTGDKYGYTGTASPFLALYKGIEDGRIKRGDTVLFWTVGVGYQLIAVLFKY